MSEAPKRAYTSGLRAAQAEATRRAILAAAERVCRTDGWPGATIVAIAMEAGVSKETVYSIFGNKVALIGETVKASVSQSAPGAHFLDEERPRTIRAVSDQVRQIELWAAYLTEILERISPLMSVVRSGADAEPEMEELYRALHRGRRANLALIAKSIRDRSVSPQGPSVEAIADILWQLASPELFDLMTRVGGYSTRRFGAWLSGMLRSALPSQ